MNLTLLCKVCKHCNIEKMSTEFYYDKSKPEGLSTFCKICSKNRASARYIKKGRLVLTEIERTNRRNTAKRKYREKNRSKLRLSAKEYNNSGQGKERGKRWRETHQEEVRVYKVQYYHRNILAIRENHTAYYEKNSDQVKAKVRDRRINEREKVNAEKAAYKAWKRSEEALLSVGERKEITKFYKYAAQNNFEVDHIIPREKRGKHCLGNLQAISSNLNQKKHTKIGRFTEHPLGICCIPYYEGISDEHLSQVLEPSKNFHILLCGTRLP